MRPSISRDGRFVAFQSTPPLDPVDTDAIPDIYVRDLLTDTITLVSRASGATGVKGNDWSSIRRSRVTAGMSIETKASNLSPGDTMPRGHPRARSCCGYDDPGHTLVGHR